MDVHACVGAGCAGYGVRIDRCVCTNVEGGESRCRCSEERHDESGWMHGGWICVVGGRAAGVEIWNAKQRNIQRNKTEINSVTIQ